MSTLAIKNLSFSLEALSRIQGSYTLAYDVEELLKAEIKLEKEKHEQIKASQETPAVSKSTNYDDIPF